MYFFTKVLLAVLVVIVLSHSNERVLQAQNFTTQRDIYRRATIDRPTVSPYLNLFNRSNNSSTPNYYQYVKPALDRQREEQRNQEQFNQLQQQLNRQTATAQQAQQGVLRPTGHQTAFLNYSHYYRMPQSR